MPYKLKDPVRHKFKKQFYNQRDWKVYDESLKNRGSLSIWFSEDAIAGWNHLEDKKRKRGRQKEFSDLAIETAHTLRLVYKQGLRQTEGLMLSIINLLGLKLNIPDHSTLSRRAKVISMKRKPINSNSPVTIIVDST